MPPPSICPSALPSEVNDQSKHVAVVIETQPALAPQSAQLVLELVDARLHRGVVGKLRLQRVLCERQKVVGQVAGGVI